MADRTLTTQQAATRLDMTVDQVRERILNGTLDAWKDGGRWRITVDSVERLEDRRWIDQNAASRR